MDTLLAISYRTFYQKYKFLEQSEDLGYTALCLPSGEWNQIAGCSMIFCNPVEFDDETVDVTDFKNAYNMTSYASKMKISCKEPLQDFAFGKNIVRTFLTCGKM